MFFWIIELHKLVIIYFILYYVGEKIYKTFFT